MPSLSFVLPHWLYWGVLLLFPLLAMFLVARQRLDLFGAIRSCREQGGLCLPGTGVDRPGG